MKKLIFINGTMGSGKTATASELLKMLNHSVFLDGDWCWMMNPFMVTDETKQMVQDNIVHLLHNFLTCSEYENVIFCWVMQYESIICSLLAKLADCEFEFYVFTLTISKQALTGRIGKDVDNHIRTPDVLERSLQRLPLYKKMGTVKIDVSKISARQAAEQIAGSIRNISGNYPLRNENEPGSLTKRLSFDDDAENYDRWRPRYPKEVYEDIGRYAELKPGTQALEIGIGTGQATEPFLKAGCEVTAVEIGPNLTAHSRKKFHDFPNLSVQNCPFEDFSGTDGCFDLIYSATAFHWIPEKIGFPKVFRLLRSGGILALWRNRPCPGQPGEELFQEIQAAYAKYRPGSKKPTEDEAEHRRKIRETILSYGFTDLKFKSYHAARIFSAENYIHLLNTYSDHRNTNPERKQKLETEIRKAIERHGNRLTVLDTIDLYLARKP